jgi:ankyrin repeat protein
MKLNVTYLREIDACSKAIAYYENKYGDNEVDIMTAYNEAEIDWQVWVLWNADINVIEHLIDHGADVNAKGGNGYTALILASFYGHIDIVRLLIDAGADVNASSNTGSTALMLASDCGYLDIVRLLIDAGADVNTSNKYGWTALMWASDCGYLDIVELLRSKGAK